MQLTWNLFLCSIRHVLGLASRAPDLQRQAYFCKETWRQNGQDCHDGLPSRQIGQQFGFLCSCIKYCNRRISTDQEIIKKKLGRLLYLHLFLFSLLRLPILLIVICSPLQWRKRIVSYVIIIPLRILIGLRVGKINCSPGGTKNSRLCWRKK